MVGGKETEEITTVIVLYIVLIYNKIPTIDQKCVFWHVLSSRYPPGYYKPKL